MSDYRVNISSSERRMHFGHFSFSLPSMPLKAFLTFLLQPSQQFAVTFSSIFCNIIKVNQRYETCRNENIKEKEKKKMQMMKALKAPLAPLLWPCLSATKQNGFEDKAVILQKVDGVVDLYLYEDVTKETKSKKRELKGFLSVMEFSLKCLQMFQRKRIVRQLSLQEKMCRFCSFLNDHRRICLLHYG